MSMIREVVRAARVGVFLAAILVAGAGAESGHRLLRAPRIKPQATRVHPGLSTSSFLVKFKDDLGVTSRSGRLYHADGREVATVNGLIDRGLVLAAEPEFEQDKSVLREWRTRGEERARTTLADLSQYFRLTLPQGSRPDAVARLCDLVNRSIDVELAFLEGIPEVAGDLAPATSDYEPIQDQLKAPPGGVGAYAAWGFPGGNGVGVTICDIEVGWHTNHEDLSKLVGNIIGGGGTDNHGTAVMGEMVADSTISGLTGIGYGVTGISYGASAKMVSVSSRSTADALALAAANLSVGDLILIELHQPGPNSPNPPSGQLGYVPMEWTPSVFDVIQTITANGIIVCEAAGNGSENLNHSSYGGWFDTTKQHSGAIMCGAGAPPSGAFGPDRSRLSFSNYGGRVDLQGYGNGVVTTGYGDLFDPGDVNQRYTAFFSGTSSASPIVTASVACIQGRFKNVSGGHTMTAKEIRDLLYATGSPQTGAVTQHIGPRPNLAAAMPLVTGFSAYAHPRTFNVSLLGAPQLTDTLWLVNPHGSPTLFDISIIDSLPILATKANTEATWGDDKSFLRVQPHVASAAAAWITLNPSSGSVPAADSVPVEVNFDGFQLTGSYFGSHYKGQLNVEVDGALGLDTLPVPVMALAQDSLHGDTIMVVAGEITHRATSETNLQGWDYNDLSTAGWLYDGSFAVGRTATGDTMVYRDLFGNARLWRGRDFWSVDSSWLPRYLIWRDSSMTDDSAIGLRYEVWVPVSGDSASFSYWRTTLYARGMALPNIYFGVVADWDLPASSGANNLGGYDTTRQMVYQTGNAGFQNEAAGFALLREQAQGGVIGSNPADVYPGGGFQDGKLFRQLKQKGWRIDASNIDVHTILSADSVGLLLPSSPVTREVLLLSSRTGVPGLEEAYARAQLLSDTLHFLSCPIVNTGDVNLDLVLTAADIIYLVNYIFKGDDPPLPIALAGDVECSGLVTSADIIYLVTHVFKGGPAPCDACLIY